MFSYFFVLYLCFHSLVSNCSILYANLQWIHPCCFRQGSFKLSDSQPICTLHIDIPSEVCDEPIKVFDSNKWSKVKDAAQKRLSRPQASSSKYWEISSNLPENLSDKCGYYRSCYSGFNAISGEISTEDSTLDINKHVRLRNQNPV